MNSLFFRITGKTIFMIKNIAFLFLCIFLISCGKEVYAPKEGSWRVVLDLGEGKGKKEISFEKPEIEENNAIKDELESFANAIKNNTQPLVSGIDGYRALEVAHIINDKIKVTSNNVHQKNLTVS